MGNIISKAMGGMHQVWRGLNTVFGHTYKEPTTGHYPDVAPHLAPQFRGRLALTVNPESGEHLCISCRQCERVCPDKCIEITAHKSPETNKLELIDFKIDHGLCMFCGLCTEVCPTSCIINTNDFEMADYSRESLIYDLKKLTLSQEESGFYFDIKDVPLPKPKPAKAAPAAKPADGAAAAAKPAAAAAAKPADGAAIAKGPSTATGTPDASEPVAAKDAASTEAAGAKAPTPSANSAEGSKPEAKLAKTAEAKTEEAKAEPANKDEAKPEAKAEESKSEDKPESKEEK
ncbi:MAG: 4Fe-4S binding protein [Candidatus Obscuribacterales bacterium]|nr:4Fe-4S binding protein [Candidatus Obscuribacterales bacterium]